MARWSSSRGPMWRWTKRSGCMRCGMLAAVRAPFHETAHEVVADLPKEIGKRLERQPDDVAPRALDAGGEEHAPSLERIRARLVHRLACGDVPPCESFVPRAEAHDGADDALGATAVVGARQTARREDLVAAPGEPLEHPESVALVPGLPEDLPLDGDGRVGGQNEAGSEEGEGAGRRLGLGQGEPAHVGGCGFSRGNALVDVRHERLEPDAQLRKESAAARGPRGEDERREFHGAFIIARTCTEEVAMTTLGRTVVSCTLSLAVIGAIAAQTPPAEVPLSLDLPEGALLAAGAQPDLELLYTGDVIGYLEDCGCKINPAGGLARRAWLVGQIKKNYPGTPILLLDTGNFSDNPTEKGDIRTVALLKEMAGLGYKVVGVGERDLTMGYDDLAKRIEGLPMKFISTNIVTQGTKKPIFAPYAIVDVPGRDGKPIRVGVLSTVRYTPVWQKSGPAGTNLAAAPVLEMVKTFLPEVREKSDVVVLMAALAKDDAHEVARQLPDIDVLIGSYGGIYSSLEEREGKVPVYYTGNQGKRIGESRINLAAGRRPSEIRTYIHFLTAKYPSDKEMADRVAALSGTKKTEPESDTTVNAPGLLVPKGAELTAKPPGH